MVFLGFSGFLLVLKASWVFNAFWFNLKIFYVVRFLRFLMVFVFCLAFYVFKGLLVYLYFIKVFHIFQSYLGFESFKVF